MRELKDIAHDIETQDNRCTAQPMLILLQEKRIYVAHDEQTHNTERMYVEDLSGDYATDTSWLKLAKQLFEYGYSKEKIRGQIREYQEGHYWKTTNVFFTDKGYEEHMALNRHNYRKNEFRTFGIHAFRNPEMKKVIETIMAAKS